MSIYLVCPPGLEPALAQETEELLGRPVVQRAGGVEADGDLMDAAGLCLWSRCAARILVVLGQVRASSLQQLEQELRKLDWSSVLHPGQQVSVKVSGRGRIKHQDAAARKVTLALRDGLRASVAGVPAGKPVGKFARGKGRGERGKRRGPSRSAARTRPMRTQVQGHHPPLPLQLRLDERIATLSLDAGGLLHKRGYRQATAKAPIRENLAACMLRMAGWRPGVPLVDPMCGAGTFSIEAGLWTQERAPGLSGRPSVVDLPSFPQGAWQEMLTEARRSANQEELQSWTADRAQGAVRAAIDNARRAGLELRVVEKDIGVPFEPAPQDPGLVVLNPPYGVRVADNIKLAPLYRKIGGSLRAQLPGWRVAVVCPDKALAGRIAKMDELCRFKNGGISVGLYVGVL